MIGENESTLSLPLSTNTGCRLSTESAEDPNSGWHLARNPMQLAILLTLIHLRGPSLPDQRTALYDSYVERFFDRESDKNVVVRENRLLLINIHSYLAWILHSEAEQGQERGSVSAERLQRLLRDYLTREEFDVELAEKLSITTVERVFFLVSRVQGTFEFEVQPLRDVRTINYPG